MPRSVGNRSWSLGKGGEKKGARKRRIQVLSQIRPHWPASFPYLEQGLWMATPKSERRSPGNGISAVFVITDLLPGCLQCPSLSALWPGRAFHSDRWHLTWTDVMLHTLGLIWQPWHGTLQMNPRPWSPQSSVAGGRGTHWGLGLTLPSNWATLF